MGKSRWQFDFDKQELPWSQQGMFSAAINQTRNIHKLLISEAETYIAKL